MADAKLLASVAAHLAGRPVTVRMRKPAAVHATGQVYRDQKGAAVMDIDPALSDWDAFLVFLHECSHLRRGDDALSTVSPNLAPGTVKRAAGSGMADPHEVGANDLARDFLDYGETYQGNFILTIEDDITRRLRALMHYPDREFWKKGR